MHTMPAVRDSTLTRNHATWPDAKPTTTVPEPGRPLSAEKPTADGRPVTAAAAPVSRGAPNVCSNTPEPSFSSNTSARKPAALVTFATSTYGRPSWLSSSISRTRASLVGSRSSAPVSSVSELNSTTPPGTSRAATLPVSSSRRTINDW